MRVIVLAGAERDIGRLAPEVAERVVEALRFLRDDPRPAGCRLLHGLHPPAWRVRVGPWRVLYRIDDGAGLITVFRVRHRSVAYRGLQR